ncbi:nadh-ubiquinone oxidoreductase [Moniliophthora roreri]|uniref:Putative ubiquinone oxidoreductase 20 kd subunit n=1 Tax=Moniliophthora roreri TaxID=221103 RepID=A0A0W0G3G8_MONRR|nr:nadh-ubiquinone oxidoreductase [Moniliophthora roreri]
MLSRRILSKANLLRSLSRASSTSSKPVPSAADKAAVVGAQAPNYPTTWSANQRPRPTARSGPRFEQTAMELQPNPLSAMEMIANEPVRVVHGRKAVCDGGSGPLGHPKIYINLDKPGPKACGYCGLRFEQAPHHH